MKSLIYIQLSVIGALFFSCATNSHLPDSRYIGEHPYGSQISIHLKNNQTLEGELIAVNPEQIYVLTNVQDKKKLQVVPASKVVDYTVSYARFKGTNYAWTIPFSLVTIAHGMYSVFTFPINLITSFAIGSKSNYTLEYLKDQITWDDLSKFARFPQGIPSNVRLEDIK